MGPLPGIKIIELAGKGPAPFCGQLLADMGAEVILVERLPLPPVAGHNDVSRRGKKAIALDLKQKAGADALLRLIETADVLIEGFRPGVMERLGLGPEVCLRLNPRLVYGRATGWGQHGPLAQSAGQDLSYVALSGALHAMGPAGQPPVPPLNLVGDIGAGGMMLCIGVLGALLERQRSGQGQIIDSAMTDGAALMMGQFFTRYLDGSWSAPRGENFADGGSHFYNVYETRDGQYVAVAAMMPEFYAELVKRLALDPARFAKQMDRTRWPELKAELSALMLTRTRTEWCALLEGADVGFAPVLSLKEAHDHPHHQARETFIDVEGMRQPAPAPRFHRTPSRVSGRGHAPGADTYAVLSASGFSKEAIAAMQAAGVVEKDVIRSEGVGQ